MSSWRLGLYQTPKIPALSGDFPANIKQLTPTPIATRNSFCPAPCLSSAARNPARRSPRNSMNPVEGSISPLAAPGERRGVIATKTRTGGLPDLASTIERSANCHRRKRSSPASRTSRAPGAAIPSTCTSCPQDGVVLFGRLAGIEDGIIELAGDLHDNLTAADRAEAEFIKSVDADVARTGMTVPEEMLPRRIGAADAGRA